VHRLFGQNGLEEASNQCLFATSVRDSPGSIVGCCKPRVALLCTDEDDPCIASQEAGEMKLTEHTIKGFPSVRSGKDYERMLVLGG
jgi:hypothetical protein